RVVDPVLADELLAAAGIRLVDADTPLGQRQAQPIRLAVLDLEIHADLLIRDRCPVRRAVVVLGPVVDELLVDPDVGGGQQRELLGLVVLDRRAPVEGVEVVLEEALGLEVAPRLGGGRRAGRHLHRFHVAKPVHRSIDVAGDVNRAVDRFRDVKAMEMAARAPATAEARRDFQSEGFFEYHLYTLDGRTTIKDNQTKQLSLLAAADIGIDKQLIYYGAQDYYRTSYGTPISNQKVGVYLEIKNSQANRLGLPLPKGRVRVYKADTGGSQQFVGEDWIDHTPKDERVKIKMGEAFDVVGERTQRNFQKIGPRTWEVEWEISLRNHKKDAQTVTVIEPVPGDWQVLQASNAPEKIEAHT